MGLKLIINIHMYYQKPLQPQREEIEDRAHEIEVPRIWGMNSKTKYICSQVLLLTLQNR